MKGSAGPCRGEGLGTVLMFGQSCFSATVTTSHMMVTPENKGARGFIMSMDWVKGVQELNRSTEQGWQADQSHMSSVIPPKSQPLHSLSQSDRGKPRYRASPLFWVAQGFSSRSGPGSQASWLGLYSGHQCTSPSQVMLHASAPLNPSRKRWLALGFQQTNSSTG